MAADSEDTGLASSLTDEAIPHIGRWQIKLRHLLAQYGIRPA